MYGGSAVNMEDGAGTVTSNGPVRWEFVWQGQDTPPYQVVVKQTVIISAESWSYGSSPGTASTNGPSNITKRTELRPINPFGVPMGWYKAEFIEGTFYQTLTGTGSITIDMPISAQAASNWTQTTHAWCSVSIHPAVISFGDSVVSSNGQLLAPIGGRVTATASIEGLSSEDAEHLWLNPGGNPFDAYVVAADFSSSHVDPGPPPKNEDVKR